MASGYKIEVSLHNDSIGNFYTGDLFTGIINLEIEKNLKVENIEMEIVGISKAQWSRFAPAVPYLKIYSEKKKILSIKQNDLFKEDIRVDKIIPAGMYCFPIHFALPQDLPSSFKSSVASVHYYLKIKSKSRRKIKKHVTFNVVSNVNLNNFDDMMRPIEYEFQHILRNSTRVLVHLKTYKCFAPRQIVPFSITIDNEKRIKIRKIRVFLVQLVDTFILFLVNKAQDTARFVAYNQKLLYTVSSGYAEEEKDICFMDYKRCENTIIDVCNFEMEIPQIAPSSINTTEPMIGISYEIRMKLMFPYHFNLIKSIPVTVAAVPVLYYEF